MVIAHQVGIPLFVTGGVGGVHRGAESCKEIFYIFNRGVHRGAESCKEIFYIFNRGVNRQRGLIL